ncbi:low temperature requirement protein A [Plantactinospora sp. GCM10030261]|uniref:low temperature requirement protein A n=1 Tax=Plantactinospora sp. GCM10030261 TaxID=3273420 RepID=UPI0036166B74
MPESKLTVAERHPTGPRRVTLLELFFDLVFVVALALVSDGLAQRISWDGVAHAVILLMAIWWVWWITVLVTNFYDPRRSAMQWLTIGVTFGSLLLAATIPRAFDRLGLGFAAVYVAIHLGRGTYLLVALRGRHLQLRHRRIVLWFSLSAAAWLIGGVVAHHPWQLVLWTLALGIDYTGGKLGYPVPGMGRIPPGQYTVTAEHLAERYQQFFIIALGNAVLVTGGTYSRTDLDLGETLAFVLSFAVTALLWRLYVHRAGEVLSGAIERTRRRERLVATAPITQMAMVVGVALMAAGFAALIHDPWQDNAPARAAIVLGGPALFLLGRARFEYEVFGRVSPNRIVGLALLGVAALLPRTIPLLTALSVALILGGIAARDTMRSRGRPPEQPNPPH